MKHPPILFDKKLLRKRLDRVAALGQDDAAFFLHEEIAARLTDRISFIKRQFKNGLELGSFNGCLQRHLSKASLQPENWTEVEASQRLLQSHSKVAQRLVADVEAIPFANQNFDLVISFLNLHWVNDVPGTLAQVQLCLQPDGLFLAAFLGGETLFELHSCLHKAEEKVRGGVAPRFSPLMSPRDAGHLLQRAGFALPVADVDRIKVTYPSMSALLSDIRHMGAANSLLARSDQPLRRDVLQYAEDAYHEHYSDRQGGLTATFDVIFMCGWSPAPSQPKALERGSGQIPLGQVLEE